MNTSDGLRGVIAFLISIGLRIIPLLGAVAFLVFILGVGKFIKSSGSEKDNKDSKSILIWGLVGMFVLATIWGIIYFLETEFNLGSSVAIPQINITS